MTTADVGFVEQAEIPAGEHQRPPARFATVLVLQKAEAFEICEACAQAERALLRCGRSSEAARMAAVFEMVEGRLVLD